MKTHKSYYLNIAATSSVNSENVLLKDGTQLPLSRSYKKDFTDAYITFVSGR